MKLSTFLFFRLFLVAAHKNLIVTQCVELGGSESERTENKLSRTFSVILTFSASGLAELHRFPFVLLSFPKTSERGQKRKILKKTNKKKRQQFLHASHVPCIPGLQ